MMNETGDTGRLALAVGAVAAGSALCLGAFFVVGGPFGTINDIGNASTGVLSGWLAWRLRKSVSDRSLDSATGLALIGAALTVAGSALVVSGTTGFLLASLVSTLGFAGIGAWLVVVTRRVATWPRRVRLLGLAAGALMAVGVAAIPGIVVRIDDMGTAPAWVWIGMVGWLGTYVAYPAWAIWLGTVQSRRTGQPVTATGESGA